MSFVHALTIGRVARSAVDLPAEVRDRAVRVTDGVPRRYMLGDVVLVPWSPGELSALEAAVRERFELELDLAEHLDQDGLLRLVWTGAELHVAFPVAAVAHERFGAMAHELGQAYEPAHVLATAEQHGRENAARLAIRRISCGRERLAALLSSRGTGSVEAWLAPRLLRDVAAGLVPELVALLGSTDHAVEGLAIEALREGGAPAADLAVPALVAQLRPVNALSIALALEAMGAAAERGLVAALDHDPLARGGALRALARLEPLADATRARLRTLAAGAGEEADEARHALGESPLARRLAASRARLGAESSARALSGHAPPRLRFAAYLGDEGCRRLDPGAPRGPLGDASAWVANLPVGAPAWRRAVAAAALDARSWASPPRSAALAQAVAASVRSGDGSVRLQELLEAHDWATIRGLDFTSLQAAIEAGEGHEAPLVGLLEGLDAHGWQRFALLLRGEVVPVVLGDERATILP